MEYILKIIETRLSSDGCFSAGSETFLVSTRKIAQFEKDHDFEYGYVDHLINAALAKIGKGFASVMLETGRKYSFTDGGQEWYADLAPDEGCEDPTVLVEITVG